MSYLPAGFNKAMELIERGVSIPNPYMVLIGDEVNLDQISTDGVVIYPGARIGGSSTVISSGCQIGLEGPVTIDNCQFGKDVTLASGYFSKSVLLDEASMGYAAHVRAGCLIEEQASIAHAVGLKQTILFPFVTMGSLINFCDVLMAGGTSREDHCEVGSGYIHFNYTPDGNKSTASIFGDVARGVLLNQRPVFLGGQGGAVGPVHTGFGTVIGAGSILREDVPEEGHMVLTAPVAGRKMPVKPHRYKRLAELVRRNLFYLANLAALDAWYRQIRSLFFNKDEFGPLILEGALSVLASAKTERLKRLRTLAKKVSPDDEGRSQFHERIDELISVCEFENPAGPSQLVKYLAANSANSYLTTIQSLDADLANLASNWLQDVVDDMENQAKQIIPALLDK